MNLLKKALKNMIGNIPITLTEQDPIELAEQLISHHKKVGLINSSRDIGIGGRIEKLPKDTPLTFEERLSRISNLVAQQTKEYTNEISYSAFPEYLHSIPWEGRIGSELSSSQGKVLTEPLPTMPAEHVSILQQAIELWLRHNNQPETLYGTVSIGEPPQDGLENIFQRRKITFTDLRDKTHFIKLLEQCELSFHLCNSDINSENLELTLGQNCLFGDVGDAGLQLYLLVGCGLLTTLNPSQEFKDAIFKRLENAIRYLNLCLFRCMSKG